MLSYLLFIAPLFAQVSFDQLTSERRDLGNTTSLKSSKSVLSSPQCQEFLDYTQNEMKTTSLIVLKGGNAEVELYARGANSETKMRMWSVSKFFSGLMLGAEVRKHGMGLLDRSLLSFGIDREENPQDRFRDWSAVQLRHVWNMSSGLNWCEYRNCQAVDAASAFYGSNRKDTVDYVLSQPLTHEPGTYYRYSAGNFMLLQKALKGLAGSEKKYLDLPYKSVLQPLGIRRSEYAFERDGKGLFLGGSGLSLTSRAFAKMGQLLLNEGRWDGRQILPKRFFKEMTTNSFAIKNSPFDVQNWEGPSGASIWLNDDSTDGSGENRNGIPAFMPTSPWSMIYAGGNYGQFLLIYPDSDLVIARTGADANHSQFWKPFSEKALECFDPSALRGDVRGPEKVAPDTGKSMSTWRALQEAIAPRMYAVEMCSCLFVSKFPDIKTCRDVVPIEKTLFWFIDTDWIVSDPDIDWFEQSISYRVPFVGQWQKAKFDRRNPELGCQIVNDL